MSTETNQVRITVACNICGESSEGDSAKDAIDWSKSHDGTCAGPRTTQVPTSEWEALVAHHDQYHAGREYCAPNDDLLCALLAAVDATATS